MNVICPHCLKPVEDGASFCPHCHGYLEDGSSSSRRPLVFCEGCGARLGAHDRVCPKCGRPAPAILSSDTSADDLAAGKTASFPALNGDERPQQGRSTVAAALDPELTNNLYTGDVDPDPFQASSPGKGDPYHPKRFPWGKVALALAVLAAVAGGAAFLYFDPMGLLPAAEESFKQAASEAFPSKAGELAEGQEPPSEEDAQDAPLTDEEAYARLSSAHARLVSYHDSFGDVIDDFNGYYAAYDRALREQASASAYGMRDGLDAIVEELEGLKLEEGSPRAEEAGKLVELAQDLRVRAQALCSCWDVSLGYAEGELPSGDEVLAPLRAAYGDGTWYNSWGAFEKGAEAAAPAVPN